MASGSSFAWKDRTITYLSFVYTVCAIAIRLIHTADWQIGKGFRLVDGADMGGFQSTRMEPITRIGLADGAAHGLDTNEEDSAHREYHTEKRQSR